VFQMSFQIQVAGDNSWAMLWIRIHMDPHQIVRLDPDPHQSDKLDPDLICR
jgi:hypothetical protein